MSFTVMNASLEKQDCMVLSIKNKEITHSYPEDMVPN